MGDLGRELQNTHVDLHALKTFVEYARIVNDHVRDDLLAGTLSEGNWTPFEAYDQGGNPLGNFDEANRVKLSAVECRKALEKRVRALSGKLDFLYRTLDQIAQNYASTDSINSDAAKKIKALLESPTAAAGPQPLP